MVHYLNCQNTDWNKYDDRLMRAVERGEVEKVASVLSKKGIIPTKLDVEGRSAWVNTPLYRHYVHAQYVYIVMMWLLFTKEIKK